MTIERMKILRDHLILLDDKKFDMSDYITTDECGTVACIAGWAYLLFDDEAEIEGDTDGIFESARQSLGLTDIQAARLFFGHFSNKVLEQITKAEAIVELNMIIETNERKE